MISTSAISGSTLLDYGPITMTLEAFQAGAPFPEASDFGAHAVLQAFNELVGSEDALAVARTYVRQLSADSRKGKPQVLRRMIESVSALGEGDFTPLAAVAGTMSDLAVKSMTEAGADYAVANNGGDIAFCLPVYKETLRVGLISDLKSGAVTHLMSVPRGSGVCGIATSGLGGRSFTRGVASAVTALGKTASLADAAATAIANACDCDDPAIVRCRAGEIDPQSDIAGLTITRSVGMLRGRSVQEALSAGAKRAEELCVKGMIFGAVIFVSGKMVLRYTKELSGAEEKNPFSVEARTVV